MDFEKAGYGKRFIAALVDGIITGVVSLIPTVGWVVAVAYSLAKDGLFEGASIGKKLMKLKVRTLDGGQADYMVSVKRNAIFAIPNVFMIIPVLGFLLAGPVGLAIAIVETFFVFTDPLGRRIGDKFAGSVVVEEETF